MRRHTVARQAVLRQHGPDVRAEKLLRRFGPGDALPDPRLEILDGFVVEFGTAERHLEALVSVTDGLDQQTLFGVAGYHGGAVVAALQDTLA